MEGEVQWVDGRRTSSRPSGRDVESGFAVGVIPSDWPMVGLTAGDNNCYRRDFS